MADELVLGIKVNGADSLASLKKDYKDLQKELETTTAGSEKYLATLKKLGAVKDDIGDLQSTINALNPEGKVAAFQNVAGKLAGGFQAATGAAALFGGKAEEVEKALLKVQAATALAEGIKSIAGLSDAFAVAGTVIKTQMITALSTLKGALIATGIGAAAVALGILISKAMEYNEALDEEFEKQNKVNEELKKTTDLYNKQAEASELLRNSKEEGLNQLQRELKLYEASGASAQAVSEAKIRAIDAEIYNLKVKKATIEGNAEKELEIEQKILDKQTERQTIILANEKAKRDEALKTYEENKKLKDQEVKDQQDRYLQEEKNHIESIERDIEAVKEARATENEEKIEARAGEQNQILTELDAMSSKDKERKDGEEKYDKEKAERSKILAKEQEDATVEAKAKGFQAAKALSDVFFQYQLNKANGNAAEELKIRKRMFQVDKAFSIARAVIDGVRSVQAAMTIPPPAGPILAGVNAVFAAAMVAKIAMQKFDGGAGSSDTSSPSLPSTGGGSVALPPTPSAPRNDSTQIGRNGENLSNPQQITVKAVVVESEVSERQARVSRLQDQARFG